MKTRVFLARSQDEALSNLARGRGSTPVKPLDRQGCASSKMLIGYVAMKESRPSLDTFGTRTTLDVDGTQFAICSLDRLSKQGYDLSRLPYSLKILLENLLRHEDGRHVRAKEIEALLTHDPRHPPTQEIAFTPARVILQDFTGVPAIVDLAAMRDAIVRLGGDPNHINPLLPVELVIDHSVQVDHFASADAFARNVALEFDRNIERYRFLRWGQEAFSNFKVVPPGTGIVHQVNLEHLARVVATKSSDGLLEAFPDTLVGTDSHTTMVNGLGVLGWGVGGIEAEAAMLGQPVSMLVPEVIGFELVGSLPEGTTATDLVLTVTQLLRKKGVVGKFVEFFGPGLKNLSLADRATVANMAPEYGATCGIFPIDAETLTYLRFTGRPKAHVGLVEAYAQAQGILHTADTPKPVFTDTLSLDLKNVEPSLAGPRRPQDRVRLTDVKSGWVKELPLLKETAKKAKTKSVAAPRSGISARADGQVDVVTDGATYTLADGSVTIAAITSCTNTSNPTVLVAAGLVAQKAVALGLSTKPWVKTSLAPGSQVVADYLRAAGLLSSLERLGFHVVGHGCTTCIGNSGPLPDAVSAAIEAGSLVVASVLSGNRNFEGRVHPEVRANYLASPPLCVAYALAGRIDIDWATESVGTSMAGNPVYLKDLWPTNTEVHAAVQRAVKSEMFEERYRNVYLGPARWQEISVSKSATYAWDKASTYIQHPPYFDGLQLEPGASIDIQNARVLAIFADSITTDHISPAGSIKSEGPAGKYLVGLGVAPVDFNSYGARRGNHEVMMRGTFANTRIKNKMVAGIEGGVTLHVPSGQTMPIYDAAMRYKADQVPLIVLAGKEYGSGSSRDWAAKGPQLLGVRAVIAESYERIHRSNLVGMGILPLEFMPNENAETLGFTGTERFTIDGIADGVKQRTLVGATVVVNALGADARTITFKTKARIDTPAELEYYRHGGILPYVLRQLATAS